MIKYIKDDIFNHLEVEWNQTIVLPHVVNDKGKFAKGFVVPLAKHFPKAKEKYLEWSKNEDPLLPFQQGNTQFVEVKIEPRIYVANMCAQTLYKANPLNYKALQECMTEVVEFTKIRNGVIKTIKFGSGLAKGDPKIIEQFVEKYWSDIDVEIFYI